MARPASRAMIGAAAFAALCVLLPVSWMPAAADPATSLIVVAAVALALALAVAANITSPPASGLARLSLTWDRGPDEPTWQSDPSAAGHVRPRAPDHG